jgi:hypothetical protein
MTDKKWEIRDALPDFAKFRPNKMIIKDHNYYKNTDISWNNKYRTSPKTYEMYHQVRDEDVPRIELMHEQEKMDHRIVEENRKERIIIDRLKDRSKLAEKTTERTILQNKSQQYFFPSHTQLKVLLENDPNEAAEALSRKLTTQRNTMSSEYKWNKLEQASKKHVNMVIRPSSIRHDEMAIEGIRKKIEFEEEIADIKKQCFEKKHDEIRNKFLQQHEKNIEFEKKVGLVPIELNKVKTPTSEIGYPASEPGMISGISSRCPTGFPKSRPGTHNSGFTTKYGGQRAHSTTNLNSSRIDKLSQVKPRFQLENEFDRHEYSGLLVRKIDEKYVYSGNHFYDKLLKQSSLFEQTLNNMKMKTSRMQSARTFDRPHSHLSKQSKISVKSFFKDGILTTENIVTQRKKDHEKDKKLSIGFDWREKGIFNDDAPLHDQNMLKDEIDDFEAIFCAGTKRVGYPKIALEEAKKLSSGQGYTEYKQEKLAKIAAGAGININEEHAQDDSENFVDNGETIE